MKLGILSRAPNSYSTRRLVEAAKERACAVSVFDPLQISIDVDRGAPALYFEDQALEHFDAVIPRIGASITFYGTAVVRHFEQMGTYTLATADAISVSRDKLRSLQVLSSHDIGLPRTAFVRNRGDVMPAIARVGGAPVIIKLLEGTQGIGVILAGENKVAEAIVETLQSAKQNVLIQKFVSESKGRDVRAFVIGDRVVAAMRRVAQGSEFRSNVHRGGKAEAIELPPDYERTAVRAAHIMGLHVAGVDMLEARDGAQVMEVNSSPGLEGIEKASGIDIAGAIIEYVQAQAVFPLLDLRERLHIAGRYSVTELLVDRESPLAGATIEGCGLRDRDVIVVAMKRGSGEQIGNPRPDRRIDEGDTLVLYGAVGALAGLVGPVLEKKRRARSEKTTKPK